jgi:hypothetical protein
MKKPAGSKIAERDPDEILPEYDFSKGRRNPYASRYVEGGLVVVLAPDVAKRFPSARAVNEALRALGDDSRSGTSKHRSRRTTK